MIDDELDDDMSDTVRKIDSEIVRDSSFTKSHIRPVVEEEFSVTKGDEE
jgi:hypothetical protein